MTNQTYINELQSFKFNSFEAKQVTQQLINWLSFVKAPPAVYPHQVISAQLVKVERFTKVALTKDVVKKLSELERNPTDTELIAAIEKVSLKQCRRQSNNATSDVSRLIDKTEMDAAADWYDTLFFLSM